MKTGPQGEEILTLIEAEDEIVKYAENSLIAYGIQRLKGKPYIHVQFSRPREFRQFYVEMQSKDDMALVNFGRLITKYIGEEE